LTDVNGDGKDDGKLLPEVVVRGKRTKSDPIFGTLWQSYAREEKNERVTGISTKKFHWQQDEIRKGSVVVAGVVAIPLAVEAGGVALLEQGIAYLSRVRLLSLGKKITQIVSKNPYANINGKINFGAALGDFSAQYATNGNDLSKINWISVASEGFIGGKLVSSSITVAAVGTYGSYTIADGFKLNNFNTANNISFGFGTLGNLFDSGFGGAFGSKYLPTAFEQGIVDTGLNLYGGLGATAATNAVTEQK
jgi:hypothetical protein